MTFGVETILHSRFCPVHCWIFIIILGFYPLLAHITPQVAITQNSPRHRCVPRRAKSYLVQKYYPKTSTIYFQLAEYFSFILQVIYFLQVTLRYALSMFILLSMLKEQELSKGNSSQDSGKDTCPQ